MITEHMKCFFADEKKLDQKQYVFFDYYFESVIDPYEAAAHLCQEQSTAQWNRVGVNEDFRNKHGAKVIDLKIKGRVKTDNYSVFKNKYPTSNACMVRIAHPHINFGSKIPNLFSAACGEGTFFSPGIASIKLMDIVFPDSYLANFEGPQFGIAGIRDLLQVYERPVLFGVIKPNLGLSPEDFAKLGYESWLGGLDVVKDDEMLSDTSWSPLIERVKLLTTYRIKSEKKTGEKKMYLVNITDEVDRLLELHDIAVKEGANAIMINTMAIGLSALRMLRKHAKVPLIGHFACTAPSVGVHTYGIHSKVITKFQRILGCDAIIIPGLGERMKTVEEEVMENIDECYKPLNLIKKSLPVPAGSNWVGEMKELYDKLGTTDFGIVPGRAVFQHPMGPKGGARGLRQGWDSVKLGIKIEEYSKNHVELLKSIEMFNPKKEIN